MTRTVDRKPITQAMQLALWKEHGAAICYVCRAMRAANNLHMDHVQALVDGGKHEIDNLRFVCVDCHRKKSAREHRNNSKAKRLAAAREAHERGEKKASRMKSRGFDKTRSRKMDGSVVPRATAE